jgi:ferredoxin
VIISKQKPLEEITAAISGYKRLAIIGCGGCAAVCQAGGTKQVEELAQSVEDKDIVFTFQIDEPCDRRILSRELRRVSDRLGSVDALVVLACGSGVQAVAEAAGKPCVAGLDTLFAGTVIHSGSYMQVCSACGECILNRTAAICPRTLCPKGITNGPCSEKIDERCASDDTETECVWVSISERIEALGLPEIELDFSPASAVARGARRRVEDDCDRERPK